MTLFFSGTETLGTFFVAHTQTLYEGEYFWDDSVQQSFYQFRQLNKKHASYKTSCDKEGETLSIDITYAEEVVAPNFHTNFAVPMVNTDGTFVLGTPPVIQKFADKLMWYRGMRETNDGFGGRYPYGNNSIYYPDGTPIPNQEYSLFFHGDSGIYNKWWKEWAEFMCNTDEALR